jgi:hypothetical protein
LNSLAISLFYSDLAWALLFTPLIGSQKESISPFLMKKAFRNQDNAFSMNLLLVFILSG